ncbi:helix-turn-helix domain-containing protein [Actinomadura sp. LOL_016]|uniref:helix-turn-helix domain-containing protein n=1 Tax=unclassified Actinomadura TaxID=2626254 RepID=UPI003A7FF936
MPTSPSPDPMSSMWAWIAHDLRFYRLKGGQSGHALAHLLNVSRSSISRLELNEARLTEAQAVILDQAWETGGHFQRLVWYAGKGHDPEWFRQHVDIEAKARVIKIWELAWVPGLLQTPDYAHANLLGGKDPNVAPLVEARLQRQGILQRAEPPILWVVVWEPVLTVPVGGRAVMRAQQNTCSTSRCFRTRRSELSPPAPVDTWGWTAHSRS